MEALEIAVTVVGPLVLLLLAWLYWRHVWFFRNPPRRAPAEPGLLSPADGRVVYVKRVGPKEPAVHVKQGLTAAVEDIAREDLAGEKLLVGVFMSPFDVHYNRAPLSGAVDFIRAHPAKPRNLNMGPMHWRCLLGKTPLYENSRHVLTNERTVTKIDGEYAGAPLSCYVVQIAGRGVRGVESYFQPGERMERGEIFGMIRVGSQVDLVIPWREGMRVLVEPGDVVRAGETIVVA